MAEAEVAADVVGVKQKGGKMKIIIASVVTLLIGIGAGWYLFGGNEDGENGGQKSVKHMPAVFFPLQTFTVNLIPEFGDQYLQVEMTLKLEDPAVIDEIKKRMPEVRNRVLYILSSKRASELTIASGKTALAAGIRDQLNMLIDPDYKPAPVPLKRHAVLPGDQDAAPGRDIPPASTAADPAATSPPVGDAHNSGLVKEVLFTSFIIQ